jgi:hypothetical protein
MNTRDPSIDLRPGTTVLGVWAHPDDEAYLSAGLMLRTVARGGRVVCLHATRGELGTDDPVAWPPDRLAHLREQELARALAVAGVREHEILGLADGECATTDPDGPIRWISAAITRLQPDLVVTFGSDGMTGHPDHVAVEHATGVVEPGPVYLDPNTGSRCERGPVIQFHGPLEVFRLYRHRGHRGFTDWPPRRLPAPGRG